jgi:hypothetical protein
MNDIYQETWLVPDQPIFALRHLETGEFICLRHDMREFLAAFSDGDTAIQFREELGLLEHVDIVNLRLGDAPFDQFWLDGEMREASGQKVARSSN